MIHYIYSVKHMYSMIALLESINIINYYSYSLDS